MSIKQSENKALKPNSRVTKNNKSAIIETKEKFCYPQYGVTIEAKDKKEADKELKNIIK